MPLDEKINIELSRQEWKALLQAIHTVMASGDPDAWLSKLA